MADITASMAAVVSGASLAIAAGSLWVSVATARRDRAHLRVELTPGMAVPSTEWYAQIQVRNDGRYAETLTDLGFRVDGKKMVMGSHHSCFGRLPAKLEPGDSFSAMISFDELHQQWIGSGL